MSVIEAPAAPQPETEVRDRADIRRQIRLMVTMAIVFVLLVYFALAIESPHVSYILGERVTKEFQPKALTTTGVSWARGGRRRACAGAGRTQPVPTSLAGRPSRGRRRADVLPRLPDVGLR